MLKRFPSDSFGKMLLIFGSPIGVGDDIVVSEMMQLGLERCRVLSLPARLVIFFWSGGFIEGNLISFSELFEFIHLTLGNECT